MNINKMIVCIMLLKSSAGARDLVTKDNFSLGIIEPSVEIEATSAAVDGDQELFSAAGRQMVSPSELTDNLEQANFCLRDVRLHESGDQAVPSFPLVARSSEFRGRV